MKPLHVFALGTLMAAALVILTSCHDEAPPGEPPYGVGSVQIVMWTDTLTFLPGDTVCGCGLVFVRDCNGVAVAGVKVDFTLLEPFGFVEFVDPTLRDTTDYVGRVEFCFCSYNQEGTQIITATAGGHSDSWTLVVRQSRLIPCQITADRDTLYVVPGSWDSMCVTVCYPESLHNGVPRLLPHMDFFPCEGGALRVRPIWPDSTDCIRYWCWLGCCGVCCFHVCDDSVCVVVDSL